MSSINWTLGFRYEPAAEDRSDAADEQDAGGGVRDVPRLAPAAPPLQPQPQLLQRPGQCHCDQNVSTHYLNVSAGVQSWQPPEAAGAVLRVPPACHELRHHQPHHVRPPQLHLPAGLQPHHPNYYLTCDQIFSPGPLEIVPQLQVNVQTQEKIFTTSHLTDEGLQWVKSLKKTSFGFRYFIYPFSRYIGSDTVALNRLVDE